MKRLESVALWGSPPNASLCILNWDRASIILQKFQQSNSKGPHNFTNAHSMVFLSFKFILSLKMTERACGYIVQRGLVGTSREALWVHGAERPCGYTVQRGFGVCSAERTWRYTGQTRLMGLQWVLVHCSWMFPGILANRSFWQKKTWFWS